MTRAYDVLLVAFLGLFFTPFSHAMEPVDPDEETPAERYALDDPEAGAQAAQVGGDFEEVDRNDSHMAPQTDEQKVTANADWLVSTLGFHMRVENQHDLVITWGQNVERFGNEFELEACVFFIGGKECFVHPGNGKNVIRVRDSRFLTFLKQPYSDSYEGILSELPEIKNHKVVKALQDRPLAALIVMGAAANKHWRKLRDMKDVRHPAQVFDGVKKLLERRHLLSVTALHVGIPTASSDIDNWTEADFEAWHHSATSEGIDQPVSVPPEAAKHAKILPRWTSQSKLNGWAVGQVADLSATGSANAAAPAPAPQRQKKSTWLSRLYKEKKRAYTEKRVERRQKKLEAAQHQLEAAQRQLAALDLE